MSVHEPRWDVRQQYLSPIVAVADVEATRQFYKDVLGFEDWFSVAGDDGRLVYCGVKWGNAYIMFDEETGLDEETLRHRGAAVNFYIRVGDADIDEYYERVRNHVKIIRPLNDRFHGDRVFVIQDPNGYKLQFARALEVISSQELSERFVRQARAESTANR